MSLLRLLLPLLLCTLLASPGQAVDALADLGVTSSSPDLVAHGSSDPPKLEQNDPPLPVACGAFSRILHLIPATDAPHQSASHPCLCWHSRAPPTALL